MNNISYDYYTSSIDPCVRSRIQEELSGNMESCNLDDYFNKKSHRIISSDITVVMRSENSVHGIIIISKGVVINKVYAYIETLFVSDQLSGRRASLDLVKNGFKKFYELYGRMPDYFVMKTYHPVTYLMIKFFSLGKSGRAPLYPEIEPIPDKPDFEDNFKDIAFGISTILNPDCNFDFSSGVIKKGGGDIDSSFWGERPLCSNKNVNNYFYNELGRTDRLLCIISCVKKIHSDIVKNNLGIK